MPPALTDCFSRTYAINLPERTDRRDELVQELGALGLRFEPGRLELFPGVKPDDAAGFPNRGVRGCFLSHLGVLKRALEERLDTVLVLEDDVQFSPLFRERIESIGRELRERKWGFVYLGHRLDLAESAGRLQPVTGDLITAHCYGIHASILPALVAYLEPIPGRPSGHPDGGPMFPDAALNLFRRRNPGVVTLAAAPSLAHQRASRSDLSPRAFDKIPLLREAAGLWRKLRGR